ncbi:MAG: nucleotidyltransferase domain-containing protein [Sulfuritalea sp.]|nr:nucleotidyltransferase domain-containing protein [Sulfuritalea sp.]
MKPSEAFKLHRDDIRRIVEQNHAGNPRVFGSVVHGEDTADSDLDLLIDPTEQTTLLSIVRIESELRRLLGVQVDVQTPGSLSERFRQTVLGEALQV